MQIRLESKSSSHQIVENLDSTFFATKYCTQNALNLKHVKYSHETDQWQNIADLENVIFRSYLPETDI